jgi:hypothetical protein
MEEQSTQAASIEEVQQRFEGWRAERKRGIPIPAALWEDALRLCASHSLSKVSSALRLDYNVLKQRLQSAFPDRFSHSAASYVQSMPPSDFIAVDLSAPLPEFIMDMERSGERMRVHIKGVWGFQPLELIKSFWGRG